MLKKVQPVLFAALLLSQACAAQPGTNVGPDDVGSDTTAIRIAPAESSDYYSIRRDFRRCAWPFCGGYWVSSLNQAQTTCPDDTVADECYITDFDLIELGLNERDQADFVSDLDGVLLRGGFGLREVEGRTLAFFEPEEAWRPLTDAEPTGYFFKAVDNGIRCFTTPCDNLEVAFLNYPWWFLLDRLNLRDVGLTEAQATEVMAALSDGGVVLAGRARASYRRSDIHLRLRASQVYLQVRPSPVSSECTIDEARGVGLCERFFGYRWDGRSCTGVSGCSCDGPDCGRLHPDQGVCEEEHATCQGPTCGGIIGLGCPGAGACADDPSDSCDPLAGGADCTGLCECHVRFACPPGSTLDDSPDVCACVEDTVSACAAALCPAGTRCIEHGTDAVCVSDGTLECGSATCGEGTLCCNASCGICTPPGSACIQVACSPFE